MVLRDSFCKICALRNKLAFALPQQESRKWYEDEVMNSTVYADSLVADKIWLVYNKKGSWKFTINIQNMFIPGEWYCVLVAFKDSLLAQNQLKIASMDVLALLNKRDGLESDKKTVVSSANDKILSVVLWEIWIYIYIYH